MGRLTEQKGFDLLIPIWKIVSESYPDWRLVIVGEGEQKAMLEEEIRIRNLRERVEIRPFTRSIVPVYLESSVYVMPSRYEGFPMVLIEAMACGLPVVSFTCPSGPTEIIREGKNGFLVPVGDYDLFARRICQLIEDIRLREQMSKEAILDSGRFTEDQIMKKWDHLFKTLICSDENLLL